MQVSRKKLNKNIKIQINEIFNQVITDIKTPTEANDFFSGLLTDTEKQALVKRLAIAIFLDKGRSYENIKNILKVSSATIATVNEHLGDPGVQMALRKIKAEDWANAWTDKITNLVGKLLPAK